MASIATAIPIPRRPRPGHVRAGYERLIKLADEFRAVAENYGHAAANLVLAEADIQRAKDALANGDVGTATKALDSAAKHAGEARVRKEMVGKAARNLASMLDTMRRWMQRTGF